MKNLTRYSMLLSVLTFLSIQAAAQEAPFSVSVGIGNSSFQLNEANIVTSYGPPLTASVHLTTAQPRSAYMARCGWTST